MYTSVIALVLALAVPPPAVDFNNFTYRVHPCPQNVPTAAVVRRGHFSYEDEKMGQGFTISVVSVKAGSLSAGTQQAAVMLECEFPMGGTASAYLFDVRGDRAILLGKIADANWGGDWGATPDTVRITLANGVLSVDTCERNGCDKRTITTFALHAGKLTKLSVKNY